MDYQITTPFTVTYFYRKHCFERTVNSRNLQTLDLDTLTDDIFNFFSDVQSTDLSSLVDIYDSTLRSLIDMLRKNNVGYQLDRRPHGTHWKRLNRRE